jgi:hypothetical protein
VTNEWDESDYQRQAQEDMAALRSVITPASLGVMTPTKNLAPRCTMSGRTQLITVGDWASDEFTESNVCHSTVRFRVRATDRPPVARILPHRTDGTPCR